jgi:hypothetical protein
MPANPNAVRGLVPLFILFAGSVGLHAQPAAGAPAEFSPGQVQAFVDRVLGNELGAAQAPDHLMRYRLRKSTPRLTTAKEIVETTNGDVARLLSVNDKPLDAAQNQQEEARLDDLLANPGKQRHRKQSEDADSARALKVLKALPGAFLYTYAGSAPSREGIIEKFTFRPNPDFNPPSLETEILTEMAGQLWIDPAAGRVTHLEGQLQQDVEFGWGILGRLNKGGWISIDQADVGDGQWRVVRFQMAMTARLLFRTRTFDTVEEETQFEPVSADLTYQGAIKMLTANP